MSGVPRLPGSPYTTPLSRNEAKPPLSVAGMSGEPALQVVTRLPTPSYTDEEPLDLDVLFRRYAPYVAAIAHRLLGRDADVDDTVQDVFVAASRGILSLRDPNAVKAWLARVTVRSARRTLHKRRLRTFFGLDEAAVYDRVVDTGASPETRALLGRVYVVLDGMPANVRIAWALRYVEGEPLESVAALSGCSLATAKRRIASAVRILDEAFSDE